jgi:DNA replication protein DnaC
MSELHPHHRIALAAYEQARATARARREAAKQPLVGTASPDGFDPIGASLAGFLDLIPWRDADVHPEHDDREMTSDGAPFCVTCQGSRWLLDRSADPRENVTKPCPDCQEALLPLRRSALARLAGISDAESTRTFVAFDQVPGAERAFAAALAFARKPDGWLHIHGLAGAGKTHLALAIANQAIYACTPVRYWYVSELVTEAKDRIGREGTSPETLRRELSECPLLILDDLGSAKATPWAVLEFLEPLVNARYKARLATVFTSLGTPAEIREHLSDSIGRRLQDPAVCVSVRNGAAQYGIPQPVADEEDVPF